MQQKSPETDLRLPVEEEVLRTAEGHQERTADGGDVFECQHREDVALLSRVSKQQDGQRNEDQQRYVVCNEHRREEYAEHQKQRQSAHRMQLSCQSHHRRQNVFLLKALQHAKHHQQRAKCSPVDLSQQILCRRRDQKTDHRGQHGKRQHGLLTDPSHNSFHSCSPVPLDICIIAYCCSVRKCASKSSNDKIHACPIRTGQR